ncbi:MAG: M48 family metallopeptidase [[Eubacterium] sulci]|nr:M48 family metallopeptidase [[Eubacterium] sulci]
MDIVVIRSDRRSFAIEIGRDKKIKVRVPRRASKAQIEEMLKAKHDWILKTLDKIEQRNTAEAREYEEAKPLSSEEVKKLKKEARNHLASLTEYWAEKIGVSYGRISIRGQKTRWGSCSSKGNLNYNYLLILCPDDVIEYVVIHELCHRVYMNHSKRFWEKIEEFCPNYRQARKWLKQNGNSLIVRLPQKEV